MTTSSTRLVLICGLPASGKSMPAVRLGKDEWTAQLGADVWDDDFRVRLEHQLWVLTQDLLALGQSVILEWGHWARAERDKKRSGREPWGWESSCTTSPSPWTSWSSEPSFVRRPASGRRRP